MADQDVSRRSFMTRTIVAIAGFIGVAVTVPLAGFGILPVVRRKEPDWSDVGSIEDLRVNEPEERRFLQAVKTGWLEEKVERTVWIVKRPDGIMAFSPSCPHLGCGYRWFPQDNQFKCPCHVSLFDIDGKVLGGPAPRSLDRLETKQEDGRLYVKFEIFQVGIATKAAA
jgi:menaquinol-cytochrome c reductase iron-sulfur subunit